MYIWRDALHRLLQNFQNHGCSLIQGLENFNPKSACRRIDLTSTSTRKDLLLRTWNNLKNHWDPYDKNILIFHLSPVGCSAGGSTNYRWKYNSISIASDVTGIVWFNSDHCTIIRASLHKPPDLVISLCSSHQVQFQKESLVDTIFIQYQTGDCTQKACRQFIVMPLSIGSR